MSAQMIPNLTHFFFGYVLAFRAPEDCVQYFTGTSGTVMSYNFENQIMQNLDYTTCFRQEQGKACTYILAYFKNSRSASRPDQDHQECWITQLSLSLFLGYCSINYAQSPEAAGSDTFDLHTDLTDGSATTMAKVRLAPSNITRCFEDFRRWIGVSELHTHPDRPFHNLRAKKPVHRCFGSTERAGRDNVGRSADLKVFWAGKQTFSKG